MTLPQLNCSHCGRIFEFGAGTGCYSVVVDDAGRLMDVVEDELIPGALYYCSDACVFKRKQGFPC